MSTEEKKEQAVNPQPEYDEPSDAPARPEQDESRIGGQAREGHSTGAHAPAQDDGGDSSASPRANTGTGARHD
ncbi:MAG TPA: hypothetical protein VEQ42_08445 [Pyrinomonadaceae bacterium]|nr:hypothetical protein [Pyrinomonadaceae bacterium]